METKKETTRERLIREGTIKPGRKAHGNANAILQRRQSFHAIVPGAGAKK
jgi:hypothetical protein